MNIRSILLTSTVAITAALALAGCGDATPTSEPTSVSTPTATSTPSSNNSGVDEFADTQNEGTVIDFVDGATSTEFNGETYSCDTGAISVRVKDDGSFECAYPAGEEFADLLEDESN